MQETYRKQNLKKVASNSSRVAGLLNLCLAKGKLKRECLEQISILLNESKNIIDDILKNESNE